MSSGKQISRNAPCPCGSGKKYKRCCGSMAGVPPASPVQQMYADAVTLFTNHPRIGDIESFNQALCGLYAAGLGLGEQQAKAATTAPAIDTTRVHTPAPPRPATSPSLPAARTAGVSRDKHVQLGRMFTDFLDRAMDVYTDGRVSTGTGGVVITGASLGLPGVECVFSDLNIERILKGTQFIGPIPENPPPHVSK